MNLLDRITRGFTSLKLVALLACCPASAHAVSASLNGVYTRAGQSTQIIVVNGVPKSNLVLNQHQVFINTFKSATESSLEGSGLTVSFTTQETATSSVFTVRYSMDGEHLLTFVSRMNYTVLKNTDNTYTVRTTWEMSYSGMGLPNTLITTSSFTETFIFDLKKFSCSYSDGAGTTFICIRITSGTGLTQGSPLIPTNPNWTVTTTITFPIINAGRATVLDPPFASAFEYSVAPGRKERISQVNLPKGFGSKIKVLAQPAKGGALKQIGTFKSGAKVNLTKKSGFSQGAKKVLIRGIKPKADLAKRAPYPVGVSFVNLQDSSAKVKIIAKEKTKKK